MEGKRGRGGEGGGERGIGREEDGGGGMEVGGEEERGRGRREQGVGDRGKGERESESTYRYCIVKFSHAYTQLHVKKRKRSMAHSSGIYYH